MFKTLFCAAAIAGCASAVRLNDAPIAAAEAMPMDTDAPVVDTDIATGAEAAAFLHAHADKPEELEAGIRSFLDKIPRPEELAAPIAEIEAIMLEHEEEVKDWFMALAGAIKAGDEEAIHQLLKAGKKAMLDVFDQLTEESQALLLEHEEEVKPVLENWFKDFVMHATAGEGQELAEGDDRKQKLADAKKKVLAIAAKYGITKADLLAFVEKHDISFGKKNLAKAAEAIKSTEPEVLLEQAHAWCTANTELDCDALEPMAKELFAEIKKIA